VSDEIHRCSECVELLGDYLDGALPPEKAAALERHLSLCMPCITFVRTYKATSRVAREQLEGLEAEMPEELMSSLRQFLDQAIPGFSCDSKKPGGCGGKKAPAPEKE
jgi:anti-sigma factor RsiW